LIGNGASIGYIEITIFVKVTNTNGFNLDIVGAEGGEVVSFVLEDFNDSSSDCSSSYNSYIDGKEGCG